MNKSLHDEFYKEILACLIEERERIAMSQSDLAALVSSTQSAISKIERSERRLDIAEFIRICDALGISAGDVVRKFENPSSRKIGETSK